MNKGMKREVLYVSISIALVSVIMFAFFINSLNLQTGGILGQLNSMSADSAEDEYPPIIKTTVQQNDECCRENGYVCPSGCKYDYYGEYICITRCVKAK